MRNYLTLLFAVTAWIVLIYGVVTAYVLWRGVGIDFKGVAASPSFWVCIGFNLLIMPFAFEHFERPLYGLAGRLVSGFKMRHGVAFALFFIIAGCVFFLPLALFRYELWIPLAVIGIAGTSGFVAGWLRGLLISTMTGGGGEWSPPTPA